jgi:hypothetical protein
MKQQISAPCKSFSWYNGFPGFFYHGPLLTAKIADDKKTKKSENKKKKKKYQFSFFP